LKLCVEAGIGEENPILWNLWDVNSYSALRSRVREVRAVIAYRNKEELGISGAEIAPYLGANPSSNNRASAKMDQFPKK
jgi:hypothetical protein